VVAVHKDRCADHNRVQRLAARPQVVAVRKDRGKMPAGVGSNAMLWLSCSLREIKDGLRGQGIDPRKLLDRIGRIA
jgi:hypothetical protein